MGLPTLLAALFDHGRIQVAPPQAAVLGDDVRQVELLLAEREATLRLEFPGETPPLAMPAAVWAATVFARACQLAVYRDLDAGAVTELLAPRCPAADPAARHWSVDVVFRFLPDLARHAAAASPNDPLVVRLGQWAEAWPLSSVGMGNVKPERKGESEITAHGGLVQLYVDRILAKKDWSRLTHPAIRAAVRRSLGGHQAAWPEVSKHLQSSSASASSHDEPE
jgi:hypothetical protein